MPYASDKQRRFFHAAEARGDIPKKVVDEFDAASKGKDLPERAKKMAHGGVCMACGGEVDADGYAYGGEVEEKPAPKELTESERSALFSKALKEKHL